MRSLFRRRGMLVGALLLGAFLMSTMGSEVRVDIPGGQSAAEIAHVLKAQGVIASPLAFRAFAKLTHLDRDLKPGIFRLRRHMLSIEALLRLAREKPESVKIVIPEGFSAKQIGDRLEANGITSAQAFEAYVWANRLEGYLFPTTYYLTRGMPAEEAAHRLHKEFMAIAQPELNKAPPGRLNSGQVVTLASIVEREARLSQEKPMIAAVYLNRLARRQRLAADPTVQYALGYWKKGLTRQDLQLASPYNTYINYGLPPGPICSPGIDTIRAVLHPAQTDALYFVANNTGGHTFSATFDEHLKAKFKAKRDRRKMQQSPQNQ